MIFITMMFLFFIGVIIILRIDNIYSNNLVDLIKKNTDVDNIEYVNKYDNCYLVKDSKYLYLFNSKYEEITNINLNLVYENKNNYDIVYRNKTIMYMEDNKNKEGIIYRYYDIYTYELIDEVVVGGSYE